MHKCSLASLIVTSTEDHTSVGNTTTVIFLNTTKLPYSCALIEEYYIVKKNKN